MSTLSDIWGEVKGWLGDSSNTDAITKLMGGGSGVLAAIAALQQEADEKALKQTSTGATTGTSAGTSTQQQTGATTQNQVGTTAQTSETTLPQWYLDLVKQQAQNIQNIKPIDEFGKTMLDMPVDQYMSPYTEQVIDPVMRRLGEDQALQRQKLAAERVSRGAFGTGRADLLANQQQERQTQEQSNILGGLYGQAFTNAQGTATSDLNRMFQEWQTMQQDPQKLATTQAGILSTLKPGQITSTTGATTGSTTGTTAQTATGATTGATTGTSAQNILGVQTGTDPSKIGNLANIFQTISGSGRTGG